MRRERGRWLIRNTLVSGSSPHARGTREEDYRELMNSRFIPACAGNAGSPCGIGISVAVHPRMRGERGWEHRAWVHCGGSSPHARGTPDTRRPAAAHARFIPACAGNADSMTMGIQVRPVHPRMRGERDRCRGLPDGAGGSSPHARGTQMVAHSGNAANRFIPACAGNAICEFVALRFGAVHPRMRGERDGWRDVVDTVVGSSPHARGTH